MGGFQLALWMRERYPAIPVFLASGGMGKAWTSYELAPRQPFFKKPYNIVVVVNHRHSVAVRMSGSQPECSY
jgi:hypothetical protein